MRSHLSFVLPLLAITACGSSSTSPISSPSEPGEANAAETDDTAGAEVAQPATRSSEEFVLLDSGLGVAPERVLVHQGEIMLEMPDPGGVHVLRDGVWTESDYVDEPSLSEQLGWEDSSERPEKLHRQPSGEVVVAGHAGERAVIWRVGAEGSRTELFDASAMGESIEWVDVAMAGERVLALTNIQTSGQHSWSLLSVGETSEAIRGGTGRASALAAIGDIAAVIESGSLYRLNVVSNDWARVDLPLAQSFYDVVADETGLIAFGGFGLIAVTGERGAGLGVPAGESQAQRYLALAAALHSVQSEAIRLSVPEGSQVTVVNHCSVCDEDAEVTSQRSGAELIQSLHEQRDAVCEGVHEDEEDPCGVFTSIEGVSCDGDCCEFGGGFDHSQPTLRKLCAEERNGELRLTRLEIAEG